ncbi:MAG: TatD family hydrolase [Limnochordia bacterium]|jgi:TatD DNase family protein|nr:TatD family hydrolase [Limnochordia bacterium]MDD2629188.1 TatD family hydrolase [Limnochordia bacterium]MDD4517390.1 TatD family hydrolase [Limnochordia bacterium]
MLIDSHAHLDNERFEGEQEEVIARAQQVGVSIIINVGWDLPSSKQAIESAAKYPGIYAAIGVHPHDASSLNNDVIKEFVALAEHPKVIAIGEIGLDYYYDLSPREQQMEAFCQQLDLAGQLRLPVIIHNRDAHEDTQQILKGYKGKLAGGVMHCFSGSVEMATTMLDYGLYLGFGGPITFKNAVRPPEVVRYTPLERMLIETDCPYLTPVPHRGKRNEPAYVFYVAEKVAQLKGLDVAEVAVATTSNARALFNLTRASLNR